MAGFRIFVLIVIWSHDCLLKSISYLKLYNCVQANDITKRSIYFKPCMGLQNTQAASLQRSNFPWWVSWIWQWTIWWWGLSNVEALELWNTPFLPLHPGPLWPGVVAPDTVLSMGQIELNSIFMLNWIVWNRTVCIKMYIALNNLQYWICHKTKPNFKQYNCTNYLGILYII